eukprot:CAMPEP_0167764750 /NCGR_PEP_ID=MMETSP0110_2-20121227/14237_1 /TAXON_ID=629695 /ORGANISM="Gymnochlora sp., Strain CCMP2014" /LENGTH=168 /DNA_ID=CAMNT_0007652251 /DNA_START=412 /DNA_END=918 /DNA_ORIENTATION=+
MELEAFRIEFDQEKTKREEIIRQLQQDIGVDLKQISPKQNFQMKQQQEIIVSTSSSYTPSENLVTEKVTMEEIQPFQPYEPVEAMVPVEAFKPLDPLVPFKPFETPIGLSEHGLVEEKLIEDKNTGSWDADSNIRAALSSHERRRRRIAEYLKRKERFDDKITSNAAK